MRLAHWRFTVPLRIRSILRGRQVERELDEELQFHIEQKIAEGIAQGLSPRAAREAALRAMQGLAQRKEEIRDTRRVRWLTDLGADLRYASRNLRHTPGLSALVVLTLALGIGMTATPFSMVDALIFRPYPVPRPGEVVSLVGTTRDSAFDGFSYREYLDLRARSKSYAGVVASSVTTPVGFSAAPDAMPRIKGGMLVSGNYFQVLEIVPQVGRAFLPGEDAVPGRDAVAILGSACWHRDFSSDPSVVGRTVRLNGSDFTVIGVAPDSFPGLAVFGGPDFYVPLAMAHAFSTNPGKSFFEDRDDRELVVKARLASDSTLQAARREIALIAADLRRTYPAQNRDRDAAVRTQFEMRTRDDDVNWKFSVIFVILGLSVLLVACTNVAGLLLSRARSRTREMAVRLALGAGRFRLIRLLLTESLILAALGGVGGVVVGYAGISLLQTFSIPAELPVTIPFYMDVRVLMASALLAAVSAVLCGLVPAIQSMRTDVVRGLKAADVEPARRVRLWGRSALVVAQVSMSLMLLAAAFLMARSFERSATQGTGFVRDHLLMARFDPRLVHATPAQTQQFYIRLTERVAGVPGVRAVALTQNPPLSLEAFERLAFVPEGVTMPADRETFTAMSATIDERTSRHSAFR